ncbi:MAG: chromate transporter [Oscillospiraceae bacterium]|nr:chromate transporter [Oscillospiraceae bacterium]
MAVLILRLYYEFFKVGLFSVGGGLATIPFLQRMGESTLWFSQVELTNMIAISECTPGPMGINMASYVGYHIAGIPGAVVATLGEITPSIVIILIIARFLRAFRQSRAVDAVFYGLRPAATALVAVAVYEVAKLALVAWDQFAASGAVWAMIHWKSLLLVAVILVCMAIPRLRKLHPIVYIGASAAVGILFRFP